VTTVGPPISDVGEGVDALLWDGRIVHVRRISEGDEEALSALYSRASPRSRYLRFSHVGISTEREVERLLMPGDDHLALLVEHDGVAIGVASYEILNGTQAEIVVLVDDSCQGDGIAGRPSHRCGRARR
jgi:hypothetical protein